MTCRVVDRNGSGETRVERAEIERRLAEGFFWLDLHAASREELEIVGDTLGFHPLALEDSIHFEQRPKLEDYDDFVFLVVFGYAPDEDGLVEVHCYFSERFLVTVRRDDAPALDELYRTYGVRRGLGSDPSLLLYRVVDGLVDSFFPVLDGFDERLSLIEDDLLVSPKEEHLRDVFTMKRRLTTLKRVVAPQRDLLGRIASGAAELPAMSPETERYFRDVYDHLIRLNEAMDTARELMGTTVDVYLSSASNRANAVMKQLAVIATIFLPLTFVTGFFGQNFPWLVDHVGGLWWFLALGLGTELLALAVLIGWFHRRGWF